MLDHNQLRQYIIQPTLDKLQEFSHNAAEMLVFTCAAESDGGTFLHQIKGNALGIYQCEPATHQDIWTNYLCRNSKLMMLMALHLDVQPSPNNHERLIYDLRYATAIARFHYRRVPEHLPNKDDIEGMYEYYKQFYNTSSGKSTKDKSIKNYKLMCGIK